MRIPPPALLIAAGAAQRLAPGRHRARRVRRLLATTLAAGSAGLMAAALVEFQRHRTTVDPVAVDTASTLVCSGVYRASRNPMYVGDVGLLAAHALLRGCWRTWIPVGVFAVLIDRCQIPAEEAALRQRFGAAYRSYCTDVPRWVGRRCRDCR